MIGHIQLGSATLAAVILAVVTPSQTGEIDKTPLTSMDPSTDPTIETTQTDAI